MHLKRSNYKVLEKIHLIVIIIYCFSILTVCVLGSLGGLSYLFFCHFTLYIPFSTL